MIHWLVKIAAALVYPINLAILLCLIGGCLLLRGKRKRSGAATLIAGLLVLIVFSLPLTADRLTRSLERQHPPLTVEQTPQADAIVVLGGSVRPAYPPREHPGLTSAADREFHTVRLFEAGKAPRVIVCGEPDGGSSLLQDLGIPEHAILEDTASRNTRQNAVEAHRIIEEQGDIDRVLLVTSAMHMGRALAAFEQVGINAVAAPTDYHVVDVPEHRRRPLIMHLLPSAASLQASTRAIHEYLGCFYYYLNGWI